MNRGRVSVTPTRPLDRVAQDPPADGPLEICRPHADQEAGVDPRSREGREGREEREDQEARAALREMEGLRPGVGGTSSGFLLVGACVVGGGALGLAERAAAGPSPASELAWFDVDAAGGQQLRSVVAMSSSSPQVMVVTSDGGFYVFNIDMEHGGEGYLVKQFSCVPLTDSYIFNI